MFRTIKSKILAIAFAVLAVITFVFMAYAYVFENKTKPLILDYYSRYIEVLKEEIDDDIIRIENNSKGLALIGSLFYKTDKDIDLTRRVVTKIFYNYPDSLGGGIWFEPYAVDKSKKRLCFYAFRDQDGEVKLDDSYNSEEYDYQNQGWYKQIISQIREKKVDVAWSLPYYENQGSYTRMVTAGSGIYDENGNVIGISTVDWEINSIEEQIRNMKFVLKTNTQSSFSSGKYIKNHFALFANKLDNSVIVLTDPYLDEKSLIGKGLENIPWYSEKLRNDWIFTYKGKMYVPYVKDFSNGMVLIFCIPREEMFHALSYMLKIMLFVLITLGFLIPYLLYLSLNKYVMRPIDILMDIARKIGNGEDVNIKIEKPEEFAQLASTYDKMTKNIKSISVDRAKIISELSIAKSIQESSLPNKYPPFPGRHEFDIFASMVPAKEIGGDFYDFFFIDETEFMFLIADVSGKGVPAALFMMTVKTLINNAAQMGYGPRSLIKLINKKICEMNNLGFFVTMLAGIVDLKTGETSLINCGHNPPLIKRKNGEYEYLKLNPNIVLGVFSDAEFEIYEVILTPGDIIFTYTDGVTESTNTNEEFYGEQRLLECLNSIEDTTTTGIVQGVKNSIKDHSDLAMQSDDITMLVFKYNGENENNVKVFRHDAVQENYNDFYNWLHDACEKWNIDMDLRNKMDICAEEIYANIMFYAYSGKKGYLEATLKRSDSSVIFEFKDEGREFDPLKKQDPDISLPPEDRPVGGLGIYMVKELADEVHYRREDNKNIFTMIFNV